MKTLLYISTFFIIIFSSCDQGCQDETACNYGMEESCKYAYSEEEILIGEWALVDIHDVNDDCIFSLSDQWDCELDDLIDSIKIEFFSNKECSIEVISSEISDDFVTANWYVNACHSFVDFSYPAATTITPDYWPFGYLSIVELYGNTFICSDLNGSILRWERI